MAEVTASHEAAIAPVICPWKYKGKYLLDQNLSKAIFVLHSTCFGTFSFRGTSHLMLNASPPLTRRPQLLKSLNFHVIY